MKNKMFRYASILVVFAMIVTFISAIIFSYHRVVDNMMQGVRDEAITYQAILNGKGVDILQNTVLSGNESQILIITKDGQIVYDSNGDVKNPNDVMEASEVELAFASGHGEASRYEASKIHKTFYYALRLDDGSVLRVERTIDSIFDVLSEGILWLVVLLMIFSTVAILMVDFVTTSIIKPVNDIDLESPLEHVAYDELRPILQKINNQNQQIYHQMEELSKQREEYLAITENMSDGLLVTSKYKVLSINKMAQKVFGIVAEEWIGRDIIAIADNQELKNVVIKALEGEQTEETITSGGLIYQMIGNPVYMRGEISGVVVFVMDVTQKLQAETIRQEFSANVSHELKTPLMSISGYAELMKNGIVQQKDIPEFANRIYQEARRLTNLVEDIIRVSKLDTKGYQLEYEDIHLKELTKEILDILQDSAQKNHIAMTVSGEEVVIRGIRSIVYEMLYNLCDNAIHYNVPYGRADVVILPTEKGVSWCVTDSGIGIAHEDQGRIFERFYRVDKSHSKETGGTGLGLSIVKHGAEIHNATLELESDVGKGTKITITFPENTSI